jgi:hypothetical protein
VDGYLLGMSGTANSNGIESIDFKYKPLPFLKSQIKKSRTF